MAEISCGLRETLGRPVPKFIFILFLLQPIMDVVSFWQSELGLGNEFTLLLRMAVLAVTVAAAFVMSERKRVYILLTAAAAVFAALHIYATFAAGDVLTVSFIIDDMTNYIRVVQIPFFALCFITFLKKDEGSYTAVKAGFVANFAIIAAIELVSVITSTNPYTYPSMELGVVGWFYFPNSQSAILCMIIPIVLCIAAKSQKKWAVPAVAVVSFAELYFFGTRLAFAGLAGIAVGMVFVWAITKSLTKRNAFIIIACAAVCVACIQVSPMYENQARRHGSLEIKQDNIDMLVDRGVAAYGDDGYEYLKFAYEEYCGGLVNKFGLERVVDYYDYSTKAEDLTYVRSIKVAYCDMLMDDMPRTSQLFGMALSDLTFENYIYDVENDFHGIYYLYGIVGIILLLAILAYFAVLVAAALIKDAKKYFTTEAGAAGIALCLGLIHVYHTAGVLRRPNASFYLSVILAIIYYLVKIYKYDKQIRN